MKREEVLAILATHQERLKALGVKSLDLFGSVARDEARSNFYCATIRLERQ